MYNMDRTVCNERAYEYIPNKHKMSHNREYYMHPVHALTTSVLTSPRVTVEVTSLTSLERLPKSKLAVRSGEVEESDN